tara:strand:- start:36364 stop:37128 length:765 start_codon:yes stop_codon:yes gene_type:complete
MVHRTMTKNYNSEEAFLADFKANEFDQILFSIDPVIFTIKDKKLHVLMVQRSNFPFKDSWALPGGRIDKLKSENIEEAVRLKLLAKTGLDHAYFEQVLTDGGKTMDPRGWSLTTVYLALVRYEDVVLGDNETGETVAWQPIDKLEELPSIAFWHHKLIKASLSRLRDKITYTDLPANLMPEVFTIRQLRMAYEAILDIEITRQAFVKRANHLIDKGLLIDTGEISDEVGRPAKLFKYVPEETPHVFSHAMTKTK